MASLLEVRSGMALFLNQSLLESGRLTVSQIQQLYRTKAFDNWKKAQDAQAKIALGVIDRLDNMTRALVNLGRS